MFSGKPLFTKSLWPRRIERPQFCLTRNLVDDLMDTIKNSISFISWSTFFFQQLDKYHCWQNNTSFGCTTKLHITLAWTVIGIFWKKNSDSIYKLFRCLRKIRSPRIMKLESSSPCLKCSGFIIFLHSIFLFFSLTSYYYLLSAMKFHDLL